MRFKPFKHLKNLFLSDRLMLTAIFVNSVIIFLLYFPAFHHNRHLQFWDHFFIIIFMVEAAVKIIVFKPKAYFSSRWNCFDFFIVVASVPSLLVQFIAIPDTSLLLLLRLFRLMRLIRLINFVPHLGKILEGLGRAIKASVFVLLALLFLNFMLAIFTCHFYGEIAPKHFGDPLISAYSIFQMFTVEGWNEIAAEISEKVANEFLVWITRLYFVLVVLVGGIFGMSLANAVFVDEMTMDNTDVIERKIDDLQQQILELKNMLEKK